MTNVPEPKLRALGKDDDIETFLTTFERTMGNCGIPEQNWTAHLAPPITGKRSWRTLPWTKTPPITTRQRRQRSFVVTILMPSATAQGLEPRNQHSLWNQLWISVLAFTTKRNNGYVKRLIVQTSWMPSSWNNYYRHYRPTFKFTTGRDVQAPQALQLNLRMPFCELVETLSQQSCSDPMKLSSNDKVCSYCHHRGHTIDECRKRKRVSQEREHNRNVTQAQVPPQNSTVDGRTYTQPTRQSQQGRPHPWPMGERAPVAREWKCA